MRYTKYHILRLKKSHIIFVNLNPEDKFHEYKEINKELKNTLEKSKQINIEELLKILDKKDIQYSSLNNIKECRQLNTYKFAIGELDHILDQKRLVKSPYEISKIRKSVILQV